MAESQVINNEVDEEILDTFDRIKANVSHLLRCKLKLSQTKKRDCIIEAAFLDTTACRTALHEDEWKWIINQIYDLHDSKRVYKIIEMEKSQLRDFTYDDLVQFILSYQLAKQQHFIRPLVFTYIPRSLMYLYIN